MIPGSRRGLGCQWTQRGGNRFSADQSVCLLLPVEPRKIESPNDDGTGKQRKTHLIMCDSSFPWWAKPQMIDGIWSTGGMGVETMNYHAARLRAGGGGCPHVRKRLTHLRPHFYAFLGFAACRPWKLWERLWEIGFINSSSSSNGIIRRRSVGD